MSINQYPWATFRKTKVGVRLHLRVVVTKDFTVPDDAIHLFDRGYVDYKQFERITSEDVRFITRLKKNAKVEMLSEQWPDPDNLIFKDLGVFLGDEQNGTKMTHPIHLIETKDAEGNSVLS